MRKDKFARPNYKRNPLRGGLRSRAGRPPDPEYVQEDRADEFVTTPERYVEVVGVVRLRQGDEPAHAEMRRVAERLRLLGFSVEYRVNVPSGELRREFDHRRVREIDVLDCVATYGSLGCTVRELAEKLYMVRDSWDDVQRRGAEAKAANWMSRLIAKDAVVKSYDHETGKSRFSSPRHVRVKTIDYSSSAMRKIDAKRAEAEKRAEEEAEPDDPELAAMLEAERQRNLAKKRGEK